jgi:serine/threonine protein kinase
VMEYIPGQDLADYIIANGRLGEAEALNYIDQIAQALDCVHQQKFFHRDVKPHNIMLRQDRGEAVLIDFGIAKEFVDLETIYLSNSLGTELYKPIEQYEKRGQFGAYTDIYALAVTLYHLLTGAAPGGGSPLYTSKARKDAQDNGGGEQIEKYLWGKLAEIGISASTQAAIKAGMEIDPSQRPQTMTKFRALLKLDFSSQTNLSILDKLDNQILVFDEGDFIEGELMELDLDEGDFIERELMKLDLDEELMELDLYSDLDFDSVTSMEGEPHLLQPSVTSESVSSKQDQKPVSKSAPLIACANVNKNSIIPSTLEAVLSYNGYRYCSISGLKANSIVYDLALQKPVLILLESTKLVSAYEVCNQIRKNFRLQNIPVIILTDQYKPISSIRSKMAGANDFLVKPSQPSLILKTIDKHIDMISRYNRDLSRKNIQKLFS